VLHDILYLFIFQRQICVATSVKVKKMCKTIANTLVLMFSIYHTLIRSIWSDLSPY
jgi:hypothetical protein